MQALLKLLLFLTILLMIIVAGYYCYIKLNAKIKASETAGALLLYSLLLFLANFLLLYGGVYLLIFCYNLFSSSGQ